MNWLINNLWGVLGFSGGATPPLVIYIPTDQIIPAIILSAIGGVVGTVVAYYVTKLLKKIDKRMR